jgi:putative ABC transport system permease protein
MSLDQVLLTSLSSLAANKLRSALTVLGIVIGVAAVIAMLGIGRGAQASVQSQIESIGTNLVFVRPGSVEQGGVRSAAGESATLTLDDASALEGLPSVASVAPELDGFVQAAFLGNNTNTRLIGVTESYLAVRHLELAVGDFISPANVTARSTAVVLGSAVADDLFGGAVGALGQSLRLNGQPYRVIGVLASKGGTGFGNQDDQVLVPITTAQARLIGARRFGGSTSLDVINVEASSADRVDSTIQEVSTVLRDRHHVPEGSEDFSVQSQQDILGTFTQVTDTFTLFLGGIAGISLVVGGIGIMNIMLVSVTERTREIGVRKAVGARRQDILSQFLAESATLSLLGGALGVLVGWLIAQLIGGVQLGSAAIHPVVGMDSVLLATVFSVAIGLFFGIYPAMRAARLEPVEALRYE